MSDYETTRDLLHFSTTCPLTSCPLFLSFIV
jgi:hypothetical protein